MKKIVFTLMYLCFLSLTIVAQDLNPGQQSQGLLESRNVTVDHCTGIFHYNIPLYTLKSGDYELPISLRYTGKGVKVNDNPGLVGYNWTLDTGGVVTRTVRGGIPDESLYGYLQFENDTVPLSEDATRVNRHKRDGECDIFTAVFNGKSVNFIIRKEEGNYFTLYAEPLERTDVKIECKHAGRTITGWTVTDNDGTRYNYMRMEWTTELNKQDEISFNGIFNAQYPSSWHLTSIEPVNSKAIEFKYRGTEANSPATYQQRVTNHYDTYQTKYEYGRPMEMPVFDFDAYREDFEEHIDAAMTAVQNYDLQLQVNSQVCLFDSIIGWYRNPNYDFIGEQSIVNHRVLGMGDFSQVSAVSEELLELLLDLSNHYETLDYSASFNFRCAYDVLLDCMNGVIKEYVSERKVNSVIKYKIISPILEAIISDEAVLFGYDSEYEQLCNIEKKTLSNNTISAYNLSFSNYRLQSVTSLDKDSIPVETISMTYYTSPNGAGTMSDIFGFHKPRINDPHAPFETSLNGEFAKIHALKEINSADGGQICLDYELNGFPSSDGGSTYGGIRIKSIVLENPAEGHKDTITYHYDQAFWTFWDFPRNYEVETYSNFTDYVWHSRVKPKGHATLSPGNNGLYYPIVREKISGQGTRCLYFNFTDYSPDWSHSHWLVGLPTFIIEQDEEGNVERVMQNFYYTDVENGLAPCLSPESLIHLDAASYNKVLPQMVANEKYMNLEDMRKEMNAGPEGGLQDANTKAFWTNIAPRIRNSYQTISYSQYYGGATVLAEQREYRPQEREYTDHWELMSREQPCNRTVYHYDKLDKHTRPTRIVNYDSRGDSTVVHQVYVSDMASTTSTDIALMQEANILSPVVKKAILGNGALQEENVIKYETVAKQNGCFYTPANICSYKGSLSDVYAMDTTVLYKGSINNYLIRKNIVCDTVCGEAYLPIEITETGIKTAFVYNRNNKRSILSSSNRSSTEILAIDCLHYKENIPARIGELSMKFWKDYLTNFNCQDIDIDEYQSYRSTERFSKGERLVELLAIGYKRLLNNTEKEEFYALIDSSETYLYPVDDFMGWHIQLKAGYYEQMGLPDPWDMDIVEMNELHERIMYDLTMENGKNMRNHILYKRPQYEGLSLSVPVGVQVYNLYLVPVQEEITVSYMVKCNGETQQLVLQQSGLIPGVLNKVSLDLSEYTHVTGITVTDFSGVQYLALVPEGTEFEATSYNEDGTISIKFDHNGKMRHHEYDSAGRLIRVRDENGKTLEENDYHVKNTIL